MLNYTKALVAVAGFAVVFAKVAADGSISGGEGLELMIAAATAFGVYRLPNRLPVA